MFLLVFTLTGRWNIRENGLGKKKKKGKRKDDDM